MKSLIFLACFLITFQSMLAQGSDEDLLQECTVYYRLSDNTPVCINNEYEPKFIRYEDEITHILLFRQDTLMENIEEGYLIGYYGEGAIRWVEYSYGDYPEGMQSIFAYYYFTDGALTQYTENNTTTNYWVPPDSCCPSTERNLEYNFRNGEFIGGEESYEDSEDEEACYSGSLDVLREDEECRIRENVEKIQTIEIVK